MDHFYENLFVIVGLTFMLLFNNLYMYSAVI